MPRGARPPPRHRRVRSALAVKEGVQHHPAQATALVSMVNNCGRMKTASVRPMIMSALDQASKYCSTAARSAPSSTAYASTVNCPRSSSRSLLDRDGRPFESIKRPIENSWHTDVTWMEAADPIERCSPTDAAFLGLRPTLQERLRTLEGVNDYRHILANIPEDLHEEYKAAESITHCCAHIRRTGRPRSGFTAASCATNH